MIWRGLLDMRPGYNPQGPARAGEAQATAVQLPPALWINRGIHSSVPYCRQLDNFHMRYSEFIGEKKKRYHKTIEKFPIWFTAGKKVKHMAMVCPLAYLCLLISSLPRLYLQS